MASWLLYLRRQIVNQRWDMNGERGGAYVHPSSPTPVPTFHFKKAGSDFMFLVIGALLLSERATLPPQRDGFLEAEQSQPGKSSFSQKLNIQRLKPDFQALNLAGYGLSGRNSATKTPASD